MRFMYPIIILFIEIIKTFITLVDRIADFKINRGYKRKKYNIEKINPVLVSRACDGLTSKKLPTKLCPLQQKVIAFSKKGLISHSLQNVANFTKVSANGENDYLMMAHTCLMTRQYSLVPAHLHKVFELNPISVPAHVQFACYYGVIYRYAYTPTEKKSCAQWRTFHLMMAREINANETARLMELYHYGSLFK